MTDTQQNNELLAQHRHIEGTYFCALINIIDTAIRVYADPSTSVTNILWGMLFDPVATYKHLSNKPSVYGTLKEDADGDMIYAMRMSAHDMSDTAEKLHKLSVQLWEEGMPTPAFPDRTTNSYGDVFQHMNGEE